MYSDLLDVLGSQPTAGAAQDSKQVVVSFKAGKMDLVKKQNGSYSCTPNPIRGTVQLVWNNHAVEWEFIDRSSKETLDTITVNGGTFQRVALNSQPGQRIYVWTTAAHEHYMYWMQSQSDDGEDEIVEKVNQYLVSPPPDEQHQVDALSNILEHLGMPQTESQEPGGGTLTLADLQGAMAGLATTGTTTATNNDLIPLSELATQASIQSLLQDEGAKARLLEFLPEGQRDEALLEQNLSSPQVQQTLRALSQSILPDDSGSLEGYHSLIANFQLDPKDGEAALQSGNPIQAFLDCVLASVKKDESEENKEGDMQE